MRKNRSNIISESLREIRRFKKIMNEAYGDEMGMPQEQGYDDEMGQYDEMGDEEMGDDMGQMQQPKKDPKMMSNSERMEASMNGEFNEDEEQSPYANDSQMRSIIDQIRELAIQGIAKYADNCMDQRYVSLKKIWEETDRFYQSFMDNKSNNK